MWISVVTICGDWDDNLYGYDIDIINNDEIDNGNINSKRNNADIALQCNIFITGNNILIIK